MLLLCFRRPAFPFVQPAALHTASSLQGSICSSLEHLQRGLHPVMDCIAGSINQHFYGSSSPLLACLVPACMALYADYTQYGQDFSASSKLLPDKLAGPLSLAALQLAVVRGAC